MFLQIVNLFDVFSYGAGVVLVFEYMPTDLSILLRNTENPLTDSQIKAYLIMLLKGVAYCHKLGIMHRVCMYSYLFILDLKINKNKYLQFALSN